MMTTATYGLRQQIIEIYAGVWGAAPDWQGLDYWFEAIDSGRMSRIDIASSFFEQPLVAEKYQGLSGDALLLALYRNIFRVESPDADGFAYWQDKITVNPALLGSQIGTLVIQMLDGMRGNAEAATTQALYDRLISASEQFYTQQKAANIPSYAQMRDAEQEAFLHIAAQLTAALDAQSTPAQINALIASAMDDLRGLFDQAPGPVAIHIAHNGVANQTLTGSPEQTDIFVFSIHADNSGAFAAFGQVRIAQYELRDGDLILLIDEQNQWNQLAQITNNVQPQAGNALIEFNHDVAETAHTQSLQILGAQTSGPFGQRLTDIHNVTFVLETAQAIEAAGGVNAYINHVLI